MQVYTIIVNNDIVYDTMALTEEDAINHVIELYQDEYKEKITKDKCKIRYNFDDEW